MKFKINNQEYDANHMLKMWTVPLVVMILVWSWWGYIQAFLSVVAIGAAVYYVDKSRQHLSLLHEEPSAGAKPVRRAAKKKADRACPCDEEAEAPGMPLLYVSVGFIGLSLITFFCLKQQQNLI